MSPCSLDQLLLLKGVEEGLSHLKKQGFLLVVLTNQPGLAQGYIRHQQLTIIHDFLKQKLNLDAIYICPHYPPVTGPCLCRKPLIGMIEKAQQALHIDVSQSYMVGDNLSDIEMGNRAKVKKTFRIGTLRADILELQHQKGIFPDFTYPTLIEVAEEISKIETT